MLQPEQDIKAIEDIKTIEVPADTEFVHPPTSPQEASGTLSIFKKIFPLFERLKNIEFY